METILKLLLIRFGIIAVIVVVLALIVFAVALQLRRRGQLTAVTSRVKQVARPLARTAVDQVVEKIARADQDRRPRDMR